MIAFDTGCIIIMLLFNFDSSGQGAACSHGELMLISTSTDLNAGRVEICYHGQWEPIPDSEWDDQDAEVACGQLGFAKEG